MNVEQVREVTVPTIDRPPMPMYCAVGFVRGIPSGVAPHYHRWCLTEELHHDVAGAVADMKFQGSKYTVDEDSIRVFQLPEAAP